MKDRKYFDYVQRIEEIISLLDSGKPNPEEAKKLFESGKKTIKECEAILNSYSGTIQETNFALQKKDHF